MKNTTKTLITIPVIAFFLLVAWATSYEDDYPYMNFVEFYFVNESDSCSVKDLELIYRVRRDNNDTLYLATEILPKDSAYFNNNLLDFRKLTYTCDCPGNVYQHSQNMEVDTFNINTVAIDCD